MKSKFPKILGILVVVLLVALLVMLAVPLISSVETDVGLTESVMTAETADLAVIDSETNLVIESNVIPVSSEITQTVLWATLGASFTILAVVHRRRFDKILYSVLRNLRSYGASADGVVMAGGPNKFISPVAA